MDAENTENLDGASKFSVKDALDMYERYKSYWADNYREATIDLNFSIGKDHWSDEDIDLRKKAGKASLVINELPQFIHQVTNDIRQNTPSIKVIPEADGDVMTADVFSGLMRGIEYKSCADEIYDTAAEYAVKCGIGFIRVDHDYCDDENEEQELKICGVHDPLSNWLDPDSIECDGRDANGAICLEPISKKNFERLYPGRKPSSFIDPKRENQDTIILGEIFIREFIGKRGKKALVRRYKFSGDDMLAETTFPGQYIPLIPVYGEEVWIDGKRFISSLIRQARDPQRRLNHWASKEAELLSMAPIAPVMAAEGTLVNERGQWQSPGSEMVLEYRTKDLDGDAAPIPARLQPPTIPTGIINAMAGAKDNIKESMGLYNASIGQKSNEVSGVAIDARKHEGDVATFHFPDNVRRSINQVGTVLVMATPEIYDTPRVIQIFNEEAEPQSVGINGAMGPPDQEQDFDLTKGKYHVRVTTGASYTTKREEAAQLFGDVIKNNPQLLQVIGDLWAKNLDVAGSEAMASRFKKMIPPALLDEGNNQPPDPEKQHMAQVIQQSQQEMQVMQQQLQQLQQELKNKQMEATVKSQDTQSKSQSEMMKLAAQEKESERTFALKTAEISLRRDELMLEDKKLDIMAREVELKYPLRLDTEQAILEHALDEKAADNQLERDLYHESVSVAMQPNPISQEAP